MVTRRREARTLARRVLDAMKLRCLDAKAWAARDRSARRSPASAGRPKALLAISWCVIVLATAGCRCPLPWGDCRIVSFDCGRDRTLDLYVDSFCDLRAFVEYEARVSGRAVAPRKSTRASFSCSEWKEGTDPSSYRLIADGAGNLFAVMFRDHEGEATVAIVFDFDRQEGFPRSAPLSRVREIPPDLLERLGLSAQDS